MVNLEVNPDSCNFNKSLSKGSFGRIADYSQGKPLGVNDLVTGVYVTKSIKKDADNSVNDENSEAQIKITVDADDTPERKTKLLNCVDVNNQHAIDLTGDNALIQENFWISEPMFQIRLSWTDYKLVPHFSDRHMSISSDRLSIRNISSPPNAIQSGNYPDHVRGSNDNTYTHPLFVAKTFLTSLDSKQKAEFPHHSDQVATRCFSPQAPPWVAIIGLTVAAPIAKSKNRRIYLKCQCPLADTFETL